MDVTRLRVFLVVSENTRENAGCNSVVSIIIYELRKKERYRVTYRLEALCIIACRGNAAHVMARYVAFLDDEVPSTLWLVPLWGGGG